MTSISITAYRFIVTPSFSSLLKEEDEKKPEKNETLFNITKLRKLFAYISTHRLMYNNNAKCVTIIMFYRDDGNCEEKNV